MRRTPDFPRVLVLIAAFAAISAAADNQWHSLFDGKTFNGWEKPAGQPFVIEDGCLKAVRRPAIDEDLFTAERYGDFELEFE